MKKFAFIILSLLSGPALADGGVYIDQVSPGGYAVDTSMKAGDRGMLLSQDGSAGTNQTMGPAYLVQLPAEPHSRRAVAAFQSSRSIVVRGGHPGFEMRSKP